MILVFLLFIFVSLAMYYAVWFLPQDGKMLGSGERVFASIFLLPFLGLGVGGLYYLYIYTPEPTLPKDLAGKIIKWYDANKDGQIHTKEEKSVIHCESNISCRTYARGDLFIAADQNKDSLVTNQELATLISIFDKNSNGTLEHETEIKTFNKKYPQYSSNGFRREYLRGKKEPLVQE
jgi:hypothetical protein